MRDPDWEADRARYPRRAWFERQSIWAVAVYRFGRRVDRRPPGVRRLILGMAYTVAFRVVETLTGISLYKSVSIGPGLLIRNFGGIIIHPASVIGRNCTLHQGVTIGNRDGDGLVPVIEDDVELGAYVQALGGIRVGRGAKILTMSVVLRDVPAGAIAFGVPARITGLTLEEWNCIPE
jgi:serine O-acetyltransferase